MEGKTLSQNQKNMVVLPEEAERQLSVVRMDGPYTTAVFSSEDNPEI